MNIPKTIKIILVCALVLNMTAFICQARAQTVSGQGSINSNVIVLTPGHSQTIFFELDTIVSQGDFHVCMLSNIGAGRLTIRISLASSVGEFAGLIYSVVGFMGLQPVYDWAYNAETISISIDVPEFSIGMLFTGILTGINNPDFPIVMGMVISLSG